MTLKVFTVLIEDLPNRKIAIEYCAFDIKIPIYYMKSSIDNSKTALNELDND